MEDGQIVSMSVNVNQICLMKKKALAPVLISGKSGQDTGSNFKLHT
jgi:hypothetical protein